MSATKQAIIYELIRQRDSLAHQLTYANAELATVKAELKEMIAERETNAVEEAVMARRLKAEEPVYESEIAI
jgi:regulator of replication initiation timing